MSNDLISRSALLEKLNQNKIPYNSDINYFITHEPTAYDVDKVVERLEDKAKGRLRKSTSPFDNWAGMAVAYKDSVSIVKAGGKDDGRCRRN